MRSSADIITETQPHCKNELRELWPAFLYNTNMKYCQSNFDPMSGVRQAAQRPLGALARASADRGR